MGRGLLSASRLGSRPLRRPCTRRRLAPNSAGPCGAAPGPSPRPRGRPDPPRVVCHFPAARGVAGLPASGPRAGSAWRHWTAARRSQPSTSTTRPVPAASPPLPHEANTPGRRPPPHSGHHRLPSEQAAQDRHTARYTSRTTPVQPQPWCPETGTARACRARRSRRRRSPCPDPAAPTHRPTVQPPGARRPGPWPCMTWPKVHPPSGFRGATPG